MFTVDNFFYWKRIVLSFTYDTPIRKCQFDRIKASRHYFKILWVYYEVHISEKLVICLEGKNAFVRLLDCRLSRTVELLKIKNGKTTMSFSGCPFAHKLLILMQKSQSKDWNCSETLNSYFFLLNILHLKGQWLKSSPLAFITQVNSWIWNLFPSDFLIYSLRNACISMFLYPFTSFLFSHGQIATGS